MAVYGEPPRANNNTRQHSVRATNKLWGAYRKHRESIESNASEGLRTHMIAELEEAGKLTGDLLEPDERA